MGRRELERDRPGRPQAHAVADRHVDRTHVVLRAQDVADALSRVEKRAVRAAACSERLVPSDQAVLRTADGGKIEQHAEMAGETEATRVGAAVPVGEEQVRRPSQRTHRLECTGELAEGEIAGKVRKARLAAHSRLFEDLAVFRVYHDGRREQHRLVGIVRHVDGRDPAQRRQAIRLDDVLRPALLKAARRRKLGREAPRRGSLSARSGRAGAAPAQSSPPKAAATTASC